MWKVSLSSAGEDEALKVDVGGLPKIPLRVSVLDGTGAVLQERQGKAGEAVTLMNVAVREGEPHYYVRVATAAKGDVAEEYQ